MATDLRKSNHNCGNCAHSRTYKPDLSKRICRGTPPQVVVIPVGGGAQLQFHWPMVDSTDEGCSLFKPKVVDMPLNAA